MLIFLDKKTFKINVCKKKSVSGIVSLKHLTVQCDLRVKILHPNCIRKILKY